MGQTDAMAVWLWGAATSYDRVDAAALGGLGRLPSVPYGSGRSRACGLYDAIKTKRQAWPGTRRTQGGTEVAGTSCEPFATRETGPGFA